MQHMDVSESTHFQSVAIKKSLPQPVLLLLPQGGFASEFNRQGRNSAIEIGEVRVDDVLPTKPITGEARTAESRPEQLLRRCHLTAQLARILDQARVVVHLQAL